MPPAGRTLGLLILLAVCGAQANEPAAAERVLAAVRSSPTLAPDLRRLCDGIGARPTGSAAMDEAAAWAVERFREAGVDSVSREAFTVPRSWSEGATRIEIAGAANFVAQAAATAWSPATPPGGIEAEILDAGGGSAGRVARLGKAAKGRILLVRLSETRTFADFGIEQRNALYAIREAEEAGAAAVLFASPHPNRLMFRHVHTLAAELDAVPSAVLAREDALRIGRLLDAGETVRARVELPNVVGGPVESWNVVAELRGSSKPEEIVLLGAHLDSWDLGTGCLDNAVNAVLAIETARALAALERRPARTVRFVLFGAEENGLLGSWAYVREHRKQLDRYTAVLVHDMGLGEISGYALNGRGELETPLREAMAPLGERASRHTREAFFGSDHFDFWLEGVPALVAMQDTSGYARSYHTAADTFDKVDLDELRRNVDVAAIATLGVADLPNRLGKRLDRNGVADLLRDTGVGDQLRFLRLWDQWERRERGRR